MPNNEDKQGCCGAQTAAEQVSTGKCGCGCSTQSDKKNNDASTCC